MGVKKFCVIGLGYFGLNLSLRLSEAGAEVLVIDNHEDLINQISDKVTHAVCMDVTDFKTLQSLDLKDMDAVIIAIGEGFETTLLATAHLQEIGVKRILTRVISPVHERLLKLMNIKEMLVPEAEAAGHLANRLMITGLLEAFKISGDYSVFEIESPAQFVNKTLLETNLRQNFSLNLVTIKRPKRKVGLVTLGEHDEMQVIGVPTPDFKILEGDILVLFGRERDLKSLLEE